jgi:hypothetical protein
VLSVVNPNEIYSFHFFFSPCLGNRKAISNGSIGKLHKACSLTIAIPISRLAAGYLRPSPRSYHSHELGAFHLYNTLQEVEAVDKSIYVN